MNKKIELLAPAGDLESAELALYYGADAIYAGGKIGSLRAESSALSNENLRKVVALCKDSNKKFYLAMNMIPHNKDLNLIGEFLEKIRDLNIDAFIVSDFGVKKIIEKIFKNSIFHLSTQANITNYESASFYKSQNFRRIILARELSHSEIKEFIKKTDIEYEIFVHGAICLSYSGRCYLSSYLSNRNGNRGECAQPCRWKYFLAEEKNDEIFPVFEDEKGAYILNSKDLCLLSSMLEIIKLGITSIKIEGRMKSAYYIASVVRAYKNAILEYEKVGKINTEYWINELKKTSHRGFTNGFFIDDNTETLEKTYKSTYINNYDFIAKVLSYDKDKNLALLESRNKFSLGDIVEVFGRNDFQKITIEKIFDEEKKSLEFSNTPMKKIYINMPFHVEKNMLIRKKK
jgi:putative protease